MREAAQGSPHSSLHIRISSFSRTSLPPNPLTPRLRSTSNANSTRPPQKQFPSSSEDLSRTIGAAGKALRGESEASITTPPSPLKTISREMVDSILRSYSFDRTLGRVTFVSPAGLEFRETLNALNEACREIDPARKRDAVFGPDMKWYDRLPNRDTDQEQLITILPLVKGTEAMDRKQQEQILLKQGLTFADPRDLAVAAALHAYHHQGHNLLAGRWVRCSEPGFGIDFDRRAGHRPAGTPYFIEVIQSAVETRHKSEMI